MALIPQKKIQYFELILSDFFNKVGREYLPWRNPRKTSSRGEPRKTSSRGKGKITAYEVWVSEIMLQQTQVSRVIGYYERFLARFPNIEVLAQATWEEFLPYYEGLGYYARGRNMLRAAQVIVSEYGGKFPREKKLLEQIPGIGPYTASAILSFAYDENHLAWDTNVSRVIGRFFFGNKKMEFDKARMESKFSLKARMLNAALMDFGSALCLARPKCEACPLRIKCRYYQEKGMQEKIQNTKYRIQNTNVDWKEAWVILFLHENHRRYFSFKKKTYEPFVLSPGYNARSGIKKYFQEKYNLLLSVRPPHKKVVLRGKPTLLVNAQILRGKPSFGVFSKREYQAYNDGEL